MSKRTLKEAIEDDSSAESFDNPKKRLKLTRPEKTSDTKSKETSLIFFENEQDNEECLSIYDTLSSLFSSKSSILYNMPIGNDILKIIAQQATGTITVCDNCNNREVFVMNDKNNLKFKSKYDKSYKCYNISCNRAICDGCCKWRKDCESYTCRHCYLRCLNDYKSNHNQNNNIDHETFKFDTSEMYCKKCIRQCIACNKPLCNNCVSKSGSIVGNMCDLCNNCLCEQCIYRQNNFMQCDECKKIFCYACQDVDECDLCSRNRDKCTKCMPVDSKCNDCARKMCQDCVDDIDNDEVITDGFRCYKCSSLYCDQHDGFFWGGSCGKQCSNNRCKNPNAKYCDNCLDQNQSHCDHWGEEYCDDCKLELQCSECGCIYCQYCVNHEKVFATCDTCESQNDNNRNNICVECAGLGQCQDFELYHCEDCWQQCKLCAC